VPLSSINAWPRLPPAFSPPSQPFQDHDNDSVTPSPLEVHGQGSQDDIQKTSQHNTQGAKRNSRTIYQQHVQSDIHHSNTNSGNDESIYPGLRFRPEVIHGEGVTVPHHFPHKVFADHLHIPSFQQFPPPVAKVERPTWKGRLFNRKVETTRSKDRNEEDHSHSFSASKTFTNLATREDTTYRNGRNVVQRAFGAIKSKGLRHRRSKSIDLDLTISYQKNYLPDQESLQRRANQERRSLDGHFDSIKYRKAKVANHHQLEDSLTDPNWKGLLSENRVMALHPHSSNVCRQANIFEHQQASRGIIEHINNTPSPETKVETNIVNDWNTQDSRNAAPLLPVRLQPAPDWTQHTLVKHTQHPPDQECFEAATPYQRIQQIKPTHDQIRHPPTRVSSQRKHDKGPRAPLPPIPDDYFPATPGVQGNHQNEWQQVRRKAVRKFEDWIVVCEVQYLSLFLHSVG